MDFLPLLVVYLTACVATFLVCIWPGGQWQKSSYTHSLIRPVKKVVMVITPAPVQRGLISLYTYVFFTRNHIFQTIYVTIHVVCHGVLLVDGMPYLYLMSQQSNHTLVPMCLLFVNMLLFMQCCMADPGLITHRNHHLYVDGYDYDGQMYKSNVKCPTCKLIKPARSKHCAITDQCVYKFDHYCVWTNNAIGGRNHNYFMAFLLSVCIISGNGAVLCVQALRVITKKSNLWQAKYLDDSGVPQAMTWHVLFQTLFMEFPRLVFLTAFLVVLTVTMTIFTGYHSYLVLSNQTTNERYKTCSMKRREVPVLPNIYDRGVLSNLYEELFPMSALGRKSNKKKK